MAHAGDALPAKTSFVGDRLCMIVSRSVLVGTACGAVGYGKIRTEVAGFFPNATNPTEGTDRGQARLSFLHTTVTHK